VYDETSMRLRVTYPGCRELVADADQQFSRGGLLVRVEPPAGLERGAAVSLELVAPGGRAAVEATVIATFPGGIAVGFDPAAAEVAALVAAARGSDSSGAPLHELDPAEPEADQEEPDQRDPSVAEQIRLALRGNRDERMAILRGVNRSLHLYVLRNPGLQLDEVAWIARQATVSADLLGQIAARREWAGRPEIAIALVRNPKTPVPLAIKLLDLVAPADLRLLAKQTSVRDPIQRAARKKLIGP
jgi:hypothetical protein